MEPFFKNCFNVQVQTSWVRFHSSHLLKAGPSGTSRWHGRLFSTNYTNFLIHRNQRLFDELLIQCGYIRVILPPRLEPYAVFYQPTYNTRMMVFTYYKRVPGAKFVIQLVFPNFIPSGPQWKLRMLESFDLSCCSVAYDGKFFYVTHDNRSATTQPVTVRQNHPSTARRVDKYLRRGFAFYIWI